MNVLLSLLTITLLLVSKQGWALAWSVGASGGINSLQSTALQTMNERLGNSLRYEQLDRHDQIDGQQLWAGLAGPTNQWQIELHTSLLSEELHGESTFQEEMNVRSGLKGYTISLRGGLRIMPILAKLTRKHVAKNWGGIQVYLLAGVGAFAWTHSYQNTFAKEATRIEYEVQAVQALASGTLRFTYLFNEETDLVFDVVGMNSSPQQARTTVASLLVQSQDQRYRAKELGLNELANARFSIVSAYIGLRFIGDF